MGTLPASLLSALVALHGLTCAVVLSALLALSLRAFVLPFVDPGRHAAVTLFRAAIGTIFLALGSFYALFAAPMLAWDARTLAVAAATAALVLVGVAFRHVMGRGRRAAGQPPRPAPRSSVTGLLVQLVLLLALLLAGTVTLMRAGFVALTEDRTILLLDVTGETASELIRWAPPNQPIREQRLVTHRVVFRRPDGDRVAEAWLYGDEVAVKGRVLRLSPVLNAAGVPNLFELLFVHNGYDSEERHNGFPHVAVPLPPQGPLAVHPWWRPFQVRLLERWETGTTAESPWAIRSATTESTYFRLEDAAGKPIRQTYRLVLTPGGLSSS